MCDFCKENDFKRIVGVKIIFEYENPEAKGYPDISFWKDTYGTKQCPICRRILEHCKE